MSITVTRPAPVVESITLTGEDAANLLVITRVVTHTDLAGWYIEFREECRKNGLEYPALDFCRKVIDAAGRDGG